MRTNVRYAIMATAAAIVLAGCASDDGGETGETSAPAPSAGAVEIEAGDLYFAPESVSAEAGEIEITLANVGAAEHDLVIEEAGDTLVAAAAAGETASGTIELSAGTYTYYCSVPGHRATMEGSLEVS